MYCNSTLSKRSILLVIVFVWSPRKRLPVDVDVITSDIELWCILWWDLSGNSKPEGMMGSLKWATLA